MVSLCGLPDLVLSVDFLPVRDALRVLAVARGPSRGRAAILALRDAVAANLGALLRFGLICPLLGGLRRVQLFWDGSLDQPGAAWLERRLNIGADEPEDLVDIAGHHGLPVIRLLPLWDSRAEVAAAIAFLTRHCDAVQLYLDASPLDMAHPFRLPGLAPQAATLSVLLLHVRVCGLGAFLVCNQETSFARVPAAPALSFRAEAAFTGPFDVSSDSS